MIEHTIPLFEIPEGVETRWASAENPSAAVGGACLDDDGRKRRACICPLPAGATAILAEARATSGTVRRIWSTISQRNPLMLRGLRLDIFWDGAETPAVSVPFGDFFCHGLGRMSTFENALFSSPEGKSFNCCVPMPFRTGMKITITNETSEDLKMFFYDVNFTVGDRHGPDMAYFHAHWRRENPTTLGQDFTLLPTVHGRGRLLGVNVSVIANKQKYFEAWWGEGELKVFLDGDKDHPTLCGTGTEDYVGTGWGQGQYAHAYQGCPIADAERFQYAFYRLHIPDPIWFQREIRVTMQQIGCWNPEAIKQLHAAGLQLRHGEKYFDMATAVTDIAYGFFEREDDWASCAWFYLDRPDGPLPALAPLPDRVAGLELTPSVEQALA